MLMWKSSIRFIEFLLVFDRKSTFKIFYIIYILAGFNHISMVIKRPLNVLGWSFPVIANLSIISREPLSRRYN